MQFPPLMMQTKVKTHLLTLVLLLATSTAQATIWDSRNTWTPQEEAAYSHWVQANWRKDFFDLEQLPGGEANPFKGLRLDCADTVYSMRYIYSYVRRLPFAILDPSGSKKLISTDMKRFDGLGSEALRARAFLSMMFGVFSTHSLPNDTFPVALAIGHVRPGGLILTTDTNHHSWSIKDILKIGVPFLVFNSRVGAKSGVILQQRQSWPNGNWVFEGNRTVDGHAGFRDWRPLAYLQEPVWKVPDYSDEQYRIAPGDWAKIGQKRLAQEAEGEGAQLVRLAQAACEDLKQRVSAVQEGVDFLHQSNYACMSAADFDAYSTPSRDHRLFDSLAELRRTFVSTMAANAGNQLGAKLRGQMLKIFPQPKFSARQELLQDDVSPISADSLCVVKYGGGRSIDLAETKRRIFAGLLSSNPVDDTSYRWGEKRGPSALARSCASWELWTPNVDEAD